MGLRPISEVESNHAPGSGGQDLSEEVGHHDQYRLQPVKRIYLSVTSADNSPLLADSELRGVNTAGVGAFGKTTA